MKTKSLLLIALAGLALSCNPDALQPDTLHSNETVQFRGKTFVPLKGEAIWTGSSETEGRCAQLNPAFITISYEAGGNMAHLGKITMSGSQCVDLTGTVMSPLDFTNDQWVVIAANGDELNFSGEGSLVPTGTPGVFDIVEHFTIDGGSSRFQDAEGWGTLGGQVIFPNFPPLPGDPAPKVINTFDGLIRY